MKAVFLPQEKLPFHKLNYTYYCCIPSQLNVISFFHLIIFYIYLPNSLQWKIIFTRVQE